MVSICKRSINVVTTYKPKMLTGLSQKALWWVQGLLLPCHGQPTPPAERADLTHPVAQDEHGKPVPLPQG